MIPLQLSRIAALTGGELHGDDVLVDAGVVTDSREAVPGSLYVARIGESSDGHAYIDGARRNGAVAALTSRVVEGLPCVVVADNDAVQEAFAAVARHVAASVEGLTIVGITGSSGKTSTKDLLAHVLAPAGETVAPVGSYNSEVGLPLTVCRVTADTRYLVAEMGASGVGHIAYLTRIAPPRIGIVLNVGSAHMGEFGSREAIGRTKAELVAALPVDGLAVLNADDPVVAAMVSTAREVGTRVQLVTTHGSTLAGDLATIEARDVELRPTGQAAFTLVTPAGERRVELSLHGEHHVGNALAVAAAALELGLPLDDVAARLATARPVSRWRMEVHDREDGVTVINDAYNANPESMTAAIRALTAMAGAGEGGRRSVAVLGQMLELGEESDVEHARVGRVAGELGVDRVVAVGAGAAALAAAARESGVGDVVEVADVVEAESLLRADLREGDVVLLKSSRDSGLRYLGDRLVGVPTP